MGSAKKRIGSCLHHDFMHCHHVGPGRLVVHLGFVGVEIIRIFRQRDRFIEHRRRARALCVEESLPNRGGGLLQISEFVLARKVE